MVIWVDTDGDCGEYSLLDAGTNKLSGHQSCICALAMAFMNERWTRGKLTICLSTGLLENEILLVWKKGHSVGVVWRQAPNLVDQVHIPEELADMWDGSTANLVTVESAALVCKNMGVDGTVLTLISILVFHTENIEQLLTVYHPGKIVVIWRIP